MPRRISTFLAIAMVCMALPGQTLAADPEPSLRIVEITAAAGTLAATVSPIPVLVTNGDQRSGRIRVDNNSGLIEDIKIRVGNYALNAAGKPVPAPDDFAFGSAGWYQFETADFSLAPGTSRDIPFTLEIPEDAGAGDHFASVSVIVEAQPGQVAAAGDGASAQTVLVIQSRLQHRVDGAAPQTPTLSLSGSNGWGTVDYVAQVTNSGNTVVGHQADPTPTLALYNLMPWGDPSRAEQTLDVGGFYVAPESMREVAVNWADAPLYGTYRAVFTLPAADGQPEVQAETTLTVVNVPMLIALLLAVAVAISILILLFAMRRLHRPSRRVTPTAAA